MLKILLVDEHQIVREGLKQLLEKTSDIVVAEEVDSANDALRLIRDKDFGMVLLNSITPSHRDIELIKQVKNLRPKLPMLLLSASPEAQFCEKSLKAGASGFLTKQSATEELVQAIRTITRGGRYICPSLMENMVDFTLGESQAPTEILSDREYEVMLAIISGKRIKQIAKEMSLSIKTVSTYHSRILQKLKFNSDAEMIRYAIEQGIIQNDIATRGNLALAELNFKADSAIAAIKEIWGIRKDVILILIVASIISYVFLSFLVSALF
jgi:DNA-binding NarL/FixJ family response regulator